MELLTTSSQSNIAFYEGMLGMHAKRVLTYEVDEYTIY